MPLYFVRHGETIANGRCYGQTDVNCRRSYQALAHSVQPKLPQEGISVFSSPSSRCRELAVASYPDRTVTLLDELKEVHFGDWENQPWANIPRKDIDAWAKNPTSFQFPNGEHLAHFSDRVTHAFETKLKSTDAAVIFTHAGVIRRLVAHIQNQPWERALSLEVPYLGVFCYKNGTIGQISH